jgi:hypothetical protein
MNRGETLAYLAGVVDGDGYFVVAKDFRTARTVHPYYRTTLGVQQLWPGKALKLFASVFDGKVTVYPSLAGTPMARCELHGQKCAAATRKLLPYLLIKKNQALVSLDVGRLRQEAQVGSAEGYARLESARQTALSLNDGSWTRSGKLLPVAAVLRGYGRLGPVELGWTQREIHAYLAGVMDSDGNLRIEKKRVRDMLGPNYRINIRCAEVVPSPALELLAKTFGGRLAVRKSQSPNERDLVSWSLHDAAAMRAVEALAPYLVVKLAEANLLLDLRRLKAEGKQGETEWVHANRWRDSVKMRKRCYTAEQVAAFERIHRAVQALHSAGRNSYRRVPAAGLTENSRKPSDPPHSSG